jgi:peptidoglycan/xylan/chitin deacetylase (PgdA/CDA1 family)
VSQEENKEDNTETITYTVTDSSGNTATATRKIEIRDIVPPVLTLNGKESITLANGAEYLEQGAFAEDDLDGDISSSVQIDGKIDTSKAGDQVLTYTSTDAAGNTATISRTIHVLKEGEKNPNAIYLTFDDGPSDTVTPEVLKILKKYKIKATFFILNYSDDDKEILQQMIDEGHTIGIHGYSHDYEKIYQSVDTFMDNITKLDEKLQKDFNYKPFVIRFPGGSSNTISRKYSEGIMTKLVKKVSDAGYDYLDWNVDSEDATGNNVAKKKLIANVTGGLQENRDNVVLMHDTNAKMTTAKSLKKIIKYAKANGFEFYAFTEGTPAVHHGTNN